MSTHPHIQGEGLAGRIASVFIHSKLTPLLMAVFMGIGIYSAVLTPKEEDPQIEVPMVDIALAMPGASPEEMESVVIEPVEHLLGNIEGVEYIFSTALPGQALISATWYVGENVEESLVGLYEELLKRMETMPEGVTMPLIKTRDVDDVPVLALTLHSTSYDDYDLRRMGVELAAEIKKINGVARVDVIGGRTRELRITPHPEQLAAYGLGLGDIAQSVASTNNRLHAGTFAQGDAVFAVETGHFLVDAADAAGIVVGVHGGQPIHLSDVATVTDGPAEPVSYVGFSSGTAGARPAVTLAIAKRPGQDAMSVSERVLSGVERLAPALLPTDVTVTTTRNYGASALGKVMELLLHLIVAIGAVTIVVGLAMGWRGGLVVFLSVPISFALTLFVYYMFGYTLNRITLFALIFVTGIVVDDSIIVAENMERHFKMRKRPFAQAAMAAISEVGNPTILATLTVIAAVLPMAFVSGLMGPYMSPMPIGASIAMMFSLLVALMVTPYLAFRLLKNHDADGEEEKEYNLEKTWSWRMYRAVMNPLLDRRVLRWGFLGGLGVLLVASLSLFYFRAVSMKMLPHDNKSEFQVMVDMPEGTTLERTHAVVRELEAWLGEQAEVTHVQTYTGTSGPVNLNGLVRHYDMRRAPHEADLQVNLLPKEERSEQSHAIARRMRGPLQDLARPMGANVKIAEVPPGPPVLSTLVAEIYGPDPEVQVDVARQVMEAFARSKGVVDVDWMVDADWTRYVLKVDREKAALAGIPVGRIAGDVNAALGGRQISRMRLPGEREPVPVMLRLAEGARSGVDRLAGLQLRTASGAMIPVGDLVQVEEMLAEKRIDRKNQQRVIYVTGDVAGEVESPVYAMFEIEDHLANIQMPAGYGFETLYTAPPTFGQDYALKWDGEWRVTYKVFRDLGIAFAVVLVVIYLLIVGWFQNLVTPLVMMVAIPLSLVGIVVGHWMMGAFFTATSMIGFIALAGIMVRNSVLLIDFIELRLREGEALRQAVLEAGAVRTRPILLTAGTVVIGAFIILFDPIFQGLAISLMGGAIASTALTLVTVPLIFYMSKRNAQ